MSTDAARIADLIFPDVTTTPEEILARTPKRTLAPGACVTRYAPSPTGFLHIGGVYAALISERIAKQSGGIFMLRLEDTDKQREVEDGVRIIAGGLAKFGITIDEGVHGDGTQSGEYGPYIQSQRLDLYKIFLKQLVAQGDAYPCFCTSTELEAQRETQELQKIKTGYYGAWAKHRSITADEVAERIARGEQFVIRVKSRGTEGEKFAFQDLVKGGLTLATNNNDAVLLKSDGFPTYHWAHIVDDKLMQTTHVIRGDEWLSSAPLHVELFTLMGWTPPQYAHISPIVKIDETGSKRKLSKRKDPEANVEFYFTEGYPVQAITEYLLNLANSNFEDWRREHPETPNTEFTLRLEKIHASGALFDFVKLADVSKNIIARFSADDVFTHVLAWAHAQDPELATWLTDNSEQAHAMFSIERSGEKRRKDLAKWSEVRESFAYFISESIAQYPWPATMPHETARAILQLVAERFDFADAPETWLEKLRGIATELQFAPDTKTFKANPTAYKGNLGDVAAVIRIALTGRTMTPDLYELMHALGETRTRARFAAAQQSLNA